MVIKVLGVDEVAYEDGMEYKDMGTQKILENCNIPWLGAGG